MKQCNATADIQCSTSESSEVRDGGYRTLDKLVVRGHRSIERSKRGKSGRAGAGRISEGKLERSVQWETSSKKADEMIVRSIELWKGNGGLYIHERAVANIVIGDKEKKETNGNDGP